MSARYEHPLGFSCSDMDDRVSDLELELAEAHRMLTRIQKAAQSVKDADDAIRSSAALGPPIDMNAALDSLYAALGDSA